jgi:hypothetical protein
MSSKEPSSEDPDSELIHVFDQAKMFEQNGANPTYLMRNLLFRANGTLPCTGFVMGFIPSSLAGNSALHSSTSNSQTFSGNPAEITYNGLVASYYAVDRTTTVPAPGESWERPQQTAYVSGRPGFSASSLAPCTSPAPPKQSFIHVTMPNRAEEPIRDPDRFLLQQSPHYLDYNYQILEKIVCHGRRYYNTTSRARRQQTSRLIHVADFIVARLWLAQEIQTLEDSAVEKQVCRSRPSTFRCGDAWSNDWYLYRSMSAAMGLAVHPKLEKFSESFATGGLANLQWVVPTDPRTWVFDRSVATMKRRGRRRRSRQLHGSGLEEDWISCAFTCDISCVRFLLIFLPL